MVTFQPHLDVIFPRVSKPRSFMQVTKARTIIIGIMSGKVVALVFGLSDKWTWAACASKKRSSKTTDRVKSSSSAREEEGRKRKKSSKEEDWRP